ncbi:MAG: hypothetical protein SPLUMA1_SPLUMAMAG1_00455 [uncultured Sulfurimonas sp.]|nr:MAG: hypothetical protein SPLUMA1_SPLUMAMAG1_00455 [uncultured Sulfurimonas sp.]
MNEELLIRLHHEEITLALNNKRAVAFFIDEILLSFILIIALWDSFTETSSTEEIILLTNSFVLEFMMMKIIYQSFFVMQYGATLGKLAMKIRVIEIKTLNNPNVLVALNRSIIRVISEMLLYLGFLWGILNPARQTWHDLSAKTLVVNA